MKFFRKFWERWFGKEADQPGLIGRDESYYEKFFGKENQLLSTGGKDEYASKVYNTDKYFVQVIFNNKIAIAKNYIDKLENISFQELKNLIRNNFKTFRPRFVGYNLAANQTLQINGDYDKAIILNHPKIIPLGNGGFAGIYPLKSVLFVIDQKILQFLINAFQSGSKLR
jgi:hypothetical protein